MHGVFVVHLPLFLVGIVTTEKGRYLYIDNRSQVGHISDNVYGINWYISTLM